MKIALDIICALQGCVSMMNGGNTLARIEEPSARRPSCKYCESSTTPPASTRDVGTSTYDLGTFVWNTEGEGMAVPTLTADDDFSCRDCMQRWNPKMGRTQSSTSMCDASTSSHDLIAYVWGTLFRPVSNSDEDEEVDEDVDERSSETLDEFCSSSVEYHTKSSEGSKKRSRVAAFFFGGAGSTTTTTKKRTETRKRRRTETKEEELFSTWNWEVRPSK